MALGPAAGDAAQGGRAGGALSASRRCAEGADRSRLRVPAVAVRRRATRTASAAGPRSPPGEKERRSWHSRSAPGGRRTSTSARRRRRATARSATDDLAHFETLDLIYRSLCALLYNYVPTSGPSRRVDLVGPLRRGDPLRRPRLRPRRSRPRRRRPDLVRRRPQGHGPLRDVGPARRDRRRRRRPSCCRPTSAGACASRTCSASAATRSPRRRSSSSSAPRRSTGTRRRRRRSSSSRPAPPASASPARSASPSGRATTGAPTRPRVHIVEGEGGLTPGRVAEALAAAGTASPRQRRPAPRLEPGLDRQRPCLPRRRHAGRLRAVGPARSSSTCTTGTWSSCPTGTTSSRCVAAQRAAAALDTGQPTAIVYRTLKGWKYGVEGKASHGAGHKLCSDGFYEALAELTGGEVGLPTCERGRPALRRRGARGPGARRRRARGVLLGGARGRARADRGRAARGGGAGRAAAGRARAPRPAGPHAARGRPARRGRLRARRARRSRRSRTSCASRRARRRPCAASSAAPSST